jgi:TrmH family RNA methyltransferase
VVLLAQHVAARLSDRQHAPGLLAEVALPAPWDGEVPRAGAVLLLALCGVQDPGNVGTLLRSARAFGARACLLAPGTADPFGPKVVRSSAGAALRLPVAAVALEALPELARRLGLQSVAAVPPERGGAGGALPLPGDAGALPARCLLLLGHETRGVPALAGCATVSVPQEPGFDSLNVAVAGSILLADWYRGAGRGADGGAPA